MKSKLLRTAFFALGEKLFGDKDAHKWRYSCPSCGRVQSQESIRLQTKKGIPSLRFGLLKEDEQLSPHSACYSPKCNWVSNGLISGPVLIIFDPGLKYSAAKGENCTHVFLFDGEELEIVEEAEGIQKEVESEDAAQPALI